MSSFDFSILQTVLSNPFYLFGVLSALTLLAALVVPGRSKRVTWYHGAFLAGWSAIFTGLTLYLAKLQSPRDWGFVPPYVFGVATITGLFLFACWLFGLALARRHAIVSGLSPRQRIASRRARQSVDSSTEDYEDASDSTSSTPWPPRGSHSVAAVS